jgi:hypothetical protein
MEEEAVVSSLMMRFCYTYKNEVVNFQQHHRHLSGYENPVLHFQEKNEKLTTI